MSVPDRKVAVFPSRYIGGDVVLWYCMASQAYYLKYEIEYYTPDGLCGNVRSLSYDARDYDQVVDIIKDAIILTDTPLKKRR